MRSKKYRWTTEQEDLIREKWTTCTLGELAAIFGVTRPQIRRKCYKMGLIKTKDMVNKIMTGRPQPKGKKNRYDNLPDGAIRYRLYHGISRPWTKLGGKWMMLHVRNWLVAGNALPKGCILKFRDRNYENCEVSNLYVITREESARLGFSDTWKVRKRVYQKKGPTKKELKAQERAERKRLRQVELTEEKRMERERRRQAREQRSLEKKSQKHESALRSKQDFQPAQKQQPQKKEFIRTLTPPAPAKRALKVFKIKPVDTSQLVMVRIDKNTIVYAKPGEDVEAVRLKYQSLKKSA